MHAIRVLGIFFSLSLLTIFGMFLIVYSATLFTQNHWGTGMFALLSGILLMMGIIGATNDPKIKKALTSLETDIKN